MNDSLKENARLRIDIAEYQNRLEAMEHRATEAEKRVKTLNKKLDKIATLVSSLKDADAVS